MIENREEIVQVWRNVADADNPAGPLYITGEFAESEITMAAQPVDTTLGASLCTGSHTIQCC